MAVFEVSHHLKHGLKELLHLKKVYEKKVAYLSGLPSVSGPPSARFVVSHTFHNGLHHLNALKKKCEKRLADLS
jgi:hypothetical protein